MSRTMDIASLQGQLIVSAQAGEGHAFRDPALIARLAVAALEGGAAAIRCGGVGGVEDIKAVRAVCEKPVIGLTKDGWQGVYITPSLAAVEQVIAAGADIVAFDGTDRPRPDASTVKDAVELIRQHGRLSMADVSTLDEAIQAHSAGADIISTTLSGYIEHTRKSTEPDLQLVADLRRHLPDAFIVAEGRYNAPELCTKAFAGGASAVVVGSAITDVTFITNRFLANGGFAP